MPYTYIAGNPAHTSGDNGVVTRVVIHATVSGCHAGGAQENGHYFASKGSGGLAHYVVDPGEVVQCAKEDVATWHAPPNQHSIGVELCDPQSGPAARWHDANHEAMLKLAAKLVADICTRQNVPMEHVNGADLLAGKHGITTHHEVNDAFHKSDHTDPGAAFPMAHFIELVHGFAGAKHLAPVPHASVVATKPATDRTLGLTNPPMTGTDVAGVRHALRVAGNAAALAEGNVYDRDTADLVNVFKANRSISESGVGPKTWAALRELVHHN